VTNDDSKEISASRRLDDESAANSVRGVMQIVIPDKFPEPRSDGYFKRCITLFSEIIEEKKGGVLFLLNSKKMVESIYRALVPVFQPKGTRLLGLGVSGGAGKTCAMFLEDPKNSVLIATKQILPQIEELEDHINVVVFQQIPFDPPDDPLLRARGNQYTNGFEQYSLPRAAIRFRDLLAELSRGNTKKTCYLLDSRIVTRDYGKFFI
jgi:ATP-dependent DNA helicase DinG